MKKLVQTTYQISLRKPWVQTQKIRIAFLSDLHNAAKKEETEAVLEMLELASPDLVLCGGDMFIARPGCSVMPAVRFMKQLAERYTVWCGTGNHEYRTRIYPEQYGRMYANYKYPLQEAGIIFLENKSAALKLGDLRIRICGFDMPRRYYSRFQRSRMPVSVLNNRFGRPDSGELTILLAHNPAQIYAYLKWGADLTFCGHYHGGLVKMPGGRALIGPDFRLFPRNAYGISAHHQRYAIVGMGLGEHTVSLRIGNPREVVIADVTVNSD